MAIVIELGDLKEIPDGTPHHECSVCGKIEPITSFNNDGGDKRTRTNCKSCYEAPHEKWEELENNATKAKANLTDRARKHLALMRAMDCGMLVEDLIAALQKLPKGSVIVMTQDGYYSDGEYASLFSPSKTEIEGNQDLNIFTIGHSSQSA